MILHYHIQKVHFVIHGTKKKVALNDFYSTLCKFCIEVSIVIEDDLPRQSVMFFNTTAAVFRLKAFFKSMNIYEIKGFSIWDSWGLMWPKSCNKYVFES